MKSFRSKVLGKRQKDLLNDVSDAHPGSAAGSEVDSNSFGQGEEGETPEAAAVRYITAFCKSQADEGADVALLPSIVDAAESSPATAAECAHRIRKLLHKDNWAQPNVVYNAIMLMRILVENPGHTFTRCMDRKFVDVARDVLRGCPHGQVVHFLVEALQDMEARLPADEGLARIVEMWQKERAKSKSAYPPPRPSNDMQAMPVQPMQPMRPLVPMHMPGPDPYAWPGGNGNGSGIVGDAHPPRGPSLPRPKDVRKRLEEARTTASVLADVVNTSGPEALLDQDLTGDLSARCRRASAQILDFLNAQQPAPDNAEMARLLEAHEAVSQSLQHYYRAVLDARKQLGEGEARRSETTGAVERAPASKGKGAAQGGPSMSGAAGGQEVAETNGSRVSDREDLYDDDNDDDDGERERQRDRERDLREDMAAAIAASTAPGPSSRSADPFADATAAGSSRSAAVNADGVSPLETSRPSAAAAGVAAVYRY